MPRPPREWLTLLFSWYLRIVAFFYIGWGGFFLALAPRFPATFARDPFANGFVWGGGFVLVGLLIFDSLTHPQGSRWRISIVALMVSWLAMFLAVWFTILLSTSNPLLSMVLILWWPACIELLNILAVVSINEENASTLPSIATMWRGAWRLLLQAHAALRRRYHPTDDQG